MTWLTFVLLLLFFYFSSLGLKLNMNGWLFVVVVSAARAGWIDG